MEMSMGFKIMTSVVPRCCTLTNWAIKPQLKEQVRFNGPSMAL